MVTISACQPIGCRFESHHSQFGQALMVCHFLGGGSLKGIRASGGPGLVVLRGPIYVTTSVSTIGPN